MTLDRALWEAQSLAARGALPGVAAAILAAAAVIALVVQPPWDRGDAFLSSLPGQRVAETTSNAARAAEFYAHLPARNQLEGRLASLFGLAGQHGLALKQGDYRTVVDAQGSFARVKISLPLQGDYRALQSFIDDALVTLPTLTVESVAFRRESGQTKAIDARLQLALFVRSSP